VVWEFRNSSAQLGEFFDLSRDTLVLTFKRGNALHDLLLGDASC
jgi:hypothetical protein